MIRQRATIARPQLIKPSPPVAAQRLIPIDALGEQQSLDAIDVPDPLGNQYFAFAAKSAPIFFLGPCRLDHRAHPRFAAFIC